MPRGRCLHSLGHWLIIFVAVVLLCWTYSLITPLNGSPDENAHTVEAAAVVRGHIVSRASARSLQLPAYLNSPNIGCWRFNPRVPATCGKPYYSDNMQLVAMPTSARNYPPLYYALVGWPTLLFRGSVAFFVMRAISSLVFSLLVASGLVLLGAGQPRVSYLGILALTPVAVFLGGAVNPQAFEYGLCVLVAGFVLPLTKSDQLLGARLLGGGISAGVLCLARPDSALWALLILALFVLATPAKRRWQWRRSVGLWTGAGSALSGGIVALCWFWIARRNAIEDPTGSPATLPGLWDNTWTNLVTHWRQATGIVGWLDVPFADFPFALISAVLAVIVFFGIAVGSRRQAAALVAALLCTPFLVILIQLPTLSSAGIIWQGRYILGWLMVAVLAAICWSSDQLPVRAGFISIGGWVVVQVWVYVSAVRRFWVGVGGRWEELLGAMPTAARVGTALGIFTWLGLAGLLCIGYRHISRGDLGQSSCLTGKDGAQRAMS